MSSSSTPTKSSSTIATEKIINGVLNKGVSLGGRVDNNRPEWVTPQITKWGFSTGDHVAGGPLKQHELDIFEKISKSQKNENKRYMINDWCLNTPQGRQWITSLADSGQYSTPTMEEGCILVIVLLGDKKIANDLINEIKPWMTELRFFPEPKTVDLNAALIPRSSLQNLEKLSKKLSGEIKGITTQLKMFQKRIEKTAKFNTMYVTIYNKASKVLELLRGPKTRSFDTGVKELKRDLSKIQKDINSFGIRKKINRTTAKKFLHIIETFLQYEMKTSEKFVKHIEFHISCVAPTLTRRSGDVKEITSKQKDAVDQRSELLEILKPMYDSNGIEKDIVDELVIKFPLVEKSIRKSTLGTLTELCDYGLLGSSEEFSDQVSVVADIHLSLDRSLVFNTVPYQILALNFHRAFSVRRSRLLLDLNTQVKISEIPWYVVFKNTFQTISPDTFDLSKSIFINYLSNFAGTQMPNKFVDILSNTLGWAGLVKEIASDIFMGSFVKTFGAQSKERESIFGVDTPYGSYYSSAFVGFPKGSEKRTVIVKDLVLEKNETKKETKKKCSCDDSTFKFYMETFGVCRCNRYNSLLYSIRSVSENRSIIERVAVSTTHNMLHLITGMGIDDDTELLEKFSKVSWKKVMESAKTVGGSKYRYTTEACRAFLIFVSLLVKSDSGLPESIMTMLEDSKEEWVTTSGDDELLGPVLNDVISAITENKIPEKPLVFTGKNRN